MGDRKGLRSVALASSTRRRLAAGPGVVRDDIVLGKRQVGGLGVARRLECEGIGLRGIRSSI